MESKVITISQQKGGAGKTTIATHIGIALMQQKYNVALLDVDPQGSMSDWYNARKMILGEENTGLHCYSSNNPWTMGSELNRLRQRYDYIIIDCPPHTKDVAQIAVKEGDIVLVPIQPSPTDLWATTNTILLANEENANTYLLLNRVVANSKLANRFIKDLPRSRLNTTIGNRLSFPTAMADGKCVTETEPNSKGTKEIKAVLKEIDALLKVTQTQKEHAYS